jgi:hypothetical protein
MNTSEFSDGLKTLQLLMVSPVLENLDENISVVLCKYCKQVTELEENVFPGISFGMCLNCFLKDSYGTLLDSSGEEATIS